jgi:hypothetical protein
MSSPPRKKRPDLDRHEPVRRFDGVFGRPRNGAHTNGGGPAGASTIAQGVEAGYRVIEDYLRQGQAYAKSSATPRSGQSSRAPDPQALAERMLQYASDLGAVWLEYVRITTGQPQAANPAKTPTDRAPGVGGFDIGGEPGAAHAGEAPRSDKTTAPRLEAPRIAIDIRSKLRAEITVDLKPGSARMALAAHDLRHRNPAIERISDVVIETEESLNRVAIRLSVSDDQPPGTYSGIVVDTDTNLPQGTLSIVLFDAAGRS